MTQHAVLARRFEELSRSFAAVPLGRIQNGMNTTAFAQAGDWQRWATSAQNLVLAAFGKDSPHYVNFAQAFEHCHQNHANEPSFMSLRGVFLSAKDDFDGGYVFNVDLRISGEVLGDLLRLAKEAMSEGHKDVAGVLACAALEDAIKRYAVSQGLDVGDNNMEDNVNLLKSKGVVGGPVKALLGSMPKIRNAALHANWDKLGAPEVASVIGFAEQFLLTKFDGA